MFNRRWLKWLWLTPVLLSLLMLLLPAVFIFSMRWLDPYTSMFMLQRQYVLWQDDIDEEVHYEWVADDKITPKMMLAVVAAEDQKFPVHFGFDLAAIEKAMAHNRDHKKIRGASTISQQVAKNLFLWPSRSWLRKGMEVYFTGLIEIFWTKQRIVEVYVNIVQFDANVFGVGAASKQFFKKTPDKLTVNETALLAAVLPNPNKYHVSRPSAYVMTRAHWIRQQMSGLGDDYIITGVVPVRQYQASVAAPAAVVAEQSEEPVEILLDEPIDETADETILIDDAPEAVVFESENTTAPEIAPIIESDRTEIMPDEIIQVDVNALP